MTENQNNGMPMQTPQVTVSPSVLVTSVNDAVLMLDTQSGVYFELDAVGGRIWELLQEHGNVDAVVNVLVREFEVELAEAHTDVTRIVHELADNKLVTIHPSVPQSS